VTAAAGLPSAPGGLAARVHHTWRLVRSRRYGDPFVLPTLDEGYVITGDPAHVAAVFAADPEVMDPPSGVVEPLLGERSVVLARAARHRRKRKVLMPPLHGARMRTYGDVIVEAARHAFAGVTPGTAVEVIGHTQRLSLDVIVRAIFGARDPARVARFHAVVDEVITRLPAWLMFSPWLHHPMFGLGPWDRYQRSAGRLCDLLREEIAAARGAPEGRDDVLSLLLAARDEEGKPMPDDELVDELRTLVIAGHETTATTLAWALWRLHRTPAALDRLRAELDAAGAGADPAALAALPFLGAVCDETLRLHPIVPIMARRLARDWTLAGRTLAAGTMVCPAVMLTHLDPAVYPDPDSFRPERFLDRRPGAGEFYPYGGGARRCLGAAMASWELRVALGTILRAHRFAPDRGPALTTVMHGVTTRPSRPIVLTLTR
jgi:cytochrome P450